MQDRYVGDVGDFAKYALLRQLAGHPTGKPIQIGVVWCLFQNESHNNDGRHVSYLDKPEFEALDDRLLVTLRQVVRSGNRRVSAVSGAKILPSETIFFDDPVSPPLVPPIKREERESYRLGWLRNCLMQTEGCQLVFFDPDNGLEVSSVPKHHPKAGKYIFWDELVPFWIRGQTLLIYHHLNRTKPAAKQVLELKERIAAKFEGASVRPLVFRRGSCRAFWLVYRQSDIGIEMERRALDLLNSGWARHFRPPDWPTGSQFRAGATS